MSVPDDRARHLATHRGLTTVLAETEEQLTALEAAGDDDAAAVVLTRRRAALERERACRERYLQLVPRIELSRCPLTGAELTHSVDVFGLDGLWWRYDAPVRPTEDVPDTFVALTGAMRLTPPVEHTTFLVKPGPDVPYVIPALLEHDGVTAVLSTVAVGHHIGYAIAYFAPAGGRALPVVASWGATHHLPDHAAERLEESDAAIDTDLAPWIRRGKLLWIGPDDTSLALREGLDGCPYLRSTGVGEHQRVESGEVWTPSSVAAG